MISARKGGEFFWCGRTRSTIMDVSPNQLVSVAASLIPFLENDDANRALMGSNMQRRPCPCCEPKPRWSGPAWKEWWPGIRGSRGGQARRGGGKRGCRPDRRRVADDPGTEWDPVRSGYLQPDQVSALEPEYLHQSEADRQEGQRVEKGPDHRRRSGHRTAGNWPWAGMCMVAFMPWGGYNFEDSILISETGGQG